jgi:hypothetical protein
VPDVVALERAELAAELTHWTQAARALADLDVVAAPAAWAALESYLGLRLRASLQSSVQRCSAVADRTAHALALSTDAAGLPTLRRAVGAVRARYLAAETVVDFYGDAVNTRTSAGVGEQLRGLDVLAVDSLDRVLNPLGIDVPPVLCYLDKGAGASILAANARIWDSSLSPVAAIKITHHNLRQPTSLVHETGHQVARLTGWNEELGEALYAALAPADRLAAEVWRGWASEVAADVYAFALLGWAPLPALATVVGGPSRSVYRMTPGDPHPCGWLRVQFGAALCRSWFGPGPWDDLARVWAARHPLSEAPEETAVVVRASIRRLPQLVDACMRAPMRAFAGRPLAALADPRRVAPAELDRLARRAGPSLHTSTYLRRLETMRILAWTVLRDRSPGGAGPPGTSSVDVASWVAALGERQEAAA